MKYEAIFLISISLLWAFSCDVDGPDTKKSGNAARDLSTACHTKMRSIDSECAFLANHGLFCNPSFFNTNDNGSIVLRSAVKHCVRAILAMPVTNCTNFQAELFFTVAFACDVHAIRFLKFEEPFEGSLPW